MYEDELSSQGESNTNHLINRFDKMLNESHFVYFDSEEIEKIIDYYTENVNKFKLREAFSLYEKLYPFSSQLKIKKAQTLLYFDKASEALKVIEEVPTTKNEEYLYTLASIYSKLDKPKDAILIFEDLLLINKNNEDIISCLANEYQKIDNFLNQQICLKGC